MSGGAVGVYNFWGDYVCGCLLLGICLLLAVHLGFYRGFPSCVMVFLVSLILLWGGAAISIFSTSFFSLICFFRSLLVFWLAGRGILIDRHIHISSCVWGKGFNLWWVGCGGTMQDSNSELLFFLVFVAFFLC